MFYMVTKGWGDMDREQLEEKIAGIVKMGETFKLNERQNRVVLQMEQKLAHMREGRAA